MIDTDVEQSDAPIGAEPTPASAPSAKESTPSGTARPHRRRLPWIALLVLALIALLIAVFDWNWFKPLVERRVSAATGREFHIDGNLGVRLSMQPLITLDRLRLGNVPHASNPTMASAERLQLRVELLPLLLRGQTEIPELRLVKPVVHLESDADGRDNWNFPPTSPGPVIRRFTITQGLLTYHEAINATDVRIQVESEDQPPEASSQSVRLAPLRFRGGGYYRNNAFTLQGTADSPLQLANTATPYRMDLSAAAGKTRIEAQGALRNPLQLNGFDLDFAIAGPDMGLLFPLLGIATPETPPYQLRGRLGHSAHVWSFDDFHGFVGKSDLAGDATIDNRGARRLMRATLSSRRLDVHDLAGFVGAPAHANPAKARTAKQAQEAAQAQASDRLLPDRSFDLGRLQTMDADVSLGARAVSGTPVPLSDFSARLVLRDGVVHLAPFDFRAAGGQVNARVVMDASRPAIATSAKIRARGIDIAQLAPDVPAIQSSAGKLGADVDLHGTGNSVAKMVATSSGRVDAGMGGGRISALLMARAALDIARILRLKIAGDHDEPVRCVIGDFDARDGVWTARRLVFSSQGTTIRGEGKLDMRDESLDMTLRVKPRGFSLLSLRSPLHVAGNLRAPDIRPDYKSIGLRGAVVAVLASIAPPAGEIGLIDIGGGKDSECNQPETANAGTGHSPPSPASARGKGRRND